MDNNILQVICLLNNSVKTALKNFKEKKKERRKREQHKKHLLKMQRNAEMFNSMFKSFQLFSGFFRDGMWFFLILRIYPDSQFETWLVKRILLHSKVIHMLLQQPTNWWSGNPKKSQIVLKM